MFSRSIDLTFNTGTGIQVVSFCLEQTAKAYALELGLAHYTISCRGHIIVRA